MKKTFKYAISFSLSCLITQLFTDNFLKKSRWSNTVERRGKKSVSALLLVIKKITNHKLKYVFKITCICAKIGKETNMLELPNKEW